MPRYLTGIQSSGQPHLGNLLGAILPALRLSHTQRDPAFYFIADLHTLTSSKDAALNRQNTYHIAAAWLACGLDTQKDVFYRQSDLTEVCQLAWILNCYTPYPMLANAHSFKDKSANLKDVNAGLFVYPVLMAADIVLYDATHVPVGKDQVQHLEMTRDIAAAFNRTMQQEVFVIPEASVQPDVMTVPGIDGRKMSKSYNNYINVFADDKALLKVVRSIVTDSLPPEAPKAAEGALYELYKVVATPQQLADFEMDYLPGGMGYGKAKDQLYELIRSRFANERLRYNEWIANPAGLDAELAKGAKKAREVGSQTLKRVRQVLGLLAS